MKPVILSKMFDCQWFTYHKVQKLLNDPTVIWYIMNKHKYDTLEWAYKIEEHCDKEFGFRETWGDVTTLGIEFVPTDSNVSVEFIDGWETITYKE
jgi:hypothetical protein